MSLDSSPVKNSGLVLRSIGFWQEFKNIAILNSLFNVSIFSTSASTFSSTAGFRNGRAMPHAEAPKAMHFAISNPVLTPPEPMIVLIPAALH